MSPQKIDSDEDLDRRLDRDIREAFSEVRSSPARHPEPDELLAYHEGNLSGAASDEVREHLVQCGECSATLLDLAAFPHLEPPDESQRLTEADIKEQWQALEQKVVEADRPFWQRSEVALQLAAVFFLALIGMAVWVGWLYRQIEELQAPASDVYLVADLRPGGALTRGEGAKVERVPSWARWVYLLLNVAPANEYGAYEVELRTAEGRRVVGRIRVHRSPQGNFSVKLPRAVLPDGGYVLELFGLGDGAPPVSLAEYSLVIESI